MNEADAPAPPPFPALLHAQRVWDSELPGFDPADAPPAPLPLFHRWFAEAVAAGQPEPHAMSLATADAEGLPDVRTLLLHDADERGFHFASHATSAKGHQLAARPYAALGFYWPSLGGRCGSGATSGAVPRPRATRTCTPGPPGPWPPP